MNIPSLVMAIVCLAGSPAATNLPEPESVRSCLTADRVCISTDVTGIASDTSVKLRGMIRDDDHIAIAIYPQSNTPSSQQELEQLARDVDDATDHQFIIGLSVGDEIVGVSSLLPPGVAADQMARAKNVSTNIVESHLTFIANIHRWLGQHPEVVLPQKSSDSQNAKASNGTGFLWKVIIWGWIIVLIGGGVVVFSRISVMRRSRQRFMAAPQNVRKLLEEVMKLRSRVNDDVLQATIKQACSDTDQYFARNTEPGFIAADAAQFSGHLTSVCEVLERYIDVQNNGRYYRDPGASLRQGREAIEGFADFVLASIQRGTDTRLMEYTVQTDILSAQRNI